MNPSQGVSCQVCRVQRKPGNIHSRESKLLKGHKILVCNLCEQRGYEPRHLIILIGRKEGYKSVLEYIEGNRYVGAPITAKELLKD